MKFGKYLASRQLELPDYLGYFIDYKALKKLIKQLGGGIDLASTEPNSQFKIQQKLKDNKASFFFRVERELDKVNLFYLEKQANMAINLDLVIMKKEELFTKSLEMALDPSSSNSTLNFKNSILFLNLYQNFKKIHQDLLRLQQFIELNEQGFLKVVKKWDKRSKSHTKELFLQTAVSVQPVFHKNEINELSDLVIQSLFDLESIMDGDYSVLENYRSTRLALAPSNYSEAIARHGSITGIEQQEMGLDKPSYGTAFPSSRHNSFTGFHTSEIDDLYSSFVNVATLKDTDVPVLKRWIEKVRSSPKGAQGDAASKYKFSKIFLLAIGNLNISDGFLKTFLDLIDYDVDFELSSEDFNNNKSLLHECVSIQPLSGHEEHQHVSINNGVKVVTSVDNVEHSRVFIIEYIIQNLSPEALSRLLIRKDMNGRTCLHYASQNNCLELLTLLLPHFPKNHLDDLDNESMSALLLAIKHNNFDVIKILVQHGSNRYPVTNESKLQYLPVNYACKFGDYQTVEYLLRYADTSPELINQQDVEGLFPLHVIARSGNYPLIKLLTEFGAKVNQLDGLNKWPPLFYAAAEGHVNTTQEFIKFGAKLDIVDEDGYNVLYYCVTEGHIGVLNHILSYKKDIAKEEKRSPVDVNMDSIPESSIPGQHKDGSVTILDVEEDSEDSGDIEKNVDLIPHLELPPPILPLRRYGHNFLEQKVLIELVFSNEKGSINLFNSATGLQPGRITITSNISDIVPRNILLPTNGGDKETTSCIFQTEVDSLNEFRIDFEIFPKFGTRLIAKTTALNLKQLDTSSLEFNAIVLPLFDLRLRNIGELKFNYQVIFPFSGTLLETTKYDTYWKSSTNFVKNKPANKLNGQGLSPNNFLSPSNINNAHGDAKNGNGVGNQVTLATAPGAKSNSSFVTATSLSGDYLRIKVCLLNDGSPFVCPHWSIAVAENVELLLPNLTPDQLTTISSSLFDYDKIMNDLSKMTVKDIALIKKLLRIIYLPLDTFLNVLNIEIRCSIELVFPSLYELDKIPFAGNIQLNLNTFIDLTLNSVFDHIRAVKVNTKNETSRSLIFLSSNSIVCKILNWKQPNFPVFLIMNGIVYNNASGVFEAHSANGLPIESSDTKGAQSTNSGSNAKSTTSETTLRANDQELTVRSIKDAVNFTIENNLIGVITSIHLLDLVPKLIPLIRSRGLVLVASNDIMDPAANPDYLTKELDIYSRTEINGLRFDDVLSFKEETDRI